MFPATTCVFMFFFCLCARSFFCHRISTQGKPFLDRGRESRLVIDNVTYDYQGEYECRATNYINGQERTATSDPIALQVVGAPQVLRTSTSATGHSVSVRKGDSATLSLIVCADPRPRHVAWEWGSLRLEAGSGIGKCSLFNPSSLRSLSLLHLPKHPKLSNHNPV